MKTFRRLIMMLLILPCIANAASGGVFDPTENPCDSDIIMPGCFMVVGDNSAISVELHDEDDVRILPIED